MGTIPSKAAVLVDRRETYAQVTLNRAAKRNALNAQMIEDLSRAFTELQNDQHVRAIILTSAGESFSTGVDIEEFSAMTPEQARGFARTVQALVNLIENLGKPVIAAISGDASGGGCELALACTWRVASPLAKFAMPEASPGLLPGFGGITRLSRIIGKSQTLEMILTGKSILADEALRIGLLNRVVIEKDELIVVCEELARQISRNAPLAIKYVLEAINRGSEASLTDGMKLESALFGLCFATEDIKEGTKAFLEKRPPHFKGI